MSDDETPEPAPAVVAAPRAAKPSMAVMGLLVFNLAATGFVAFKLLTAHPAEAAAAKPPEAKVEPAGPIVPFEPFVVNLDEPGTSRYLKCTLQFQVAPKSEEVLAKNKEVVRDAVLSYLSGLHLKDTLGAEAKDKIRTDLLARIGKLVGPDKIHRMFFQDFVVQ
jgi:flagellar FliL protein